MRRLSLIAATVVAASLQGCAYYSVPLRAPTGAAYPQSAQQPAPGLSIGELLQMLQAKRPQADIIADLRSRGLRVAPAPADYDVLAAAGASPELMQTLQAASAYAGAQVANGGVPQGQVIQEPYAYYDATYPRVPFGLGLGFGFFAGSTSIWGYPYYRGYAPHRPFGGHVYTPRVVPFQGHSFGRPLQGHSFGKPFPGGGSHFRGRR